MAHAAWKAKLEAYAEGTLRWPLTWAVESHTRHCPECCTELRAQLAFWRKLDRVVHNRDEMVTTVHRVAQREISRMTQARSKVRWFSTALAGAAALVLLVAMVPSGLSSIFTPSVTVVAASSWSEGVATSLPANTGIEGPSSVLTNPSGVGKGTGVAVPVPQTEERGG